MNVYDFDKTIYNGDSSVDFYLFALKQNLLLLRYIPKQAWGFVLYALKRISKTQLKEYFFCFLSGINAGITVEKFWKKNKNKIFSWYLNQQQPTDIVISASPEFLLKPLCNELKIVHLIASDVDIATGKFNGNNCYGEEKANRLRSEYGISHIDNFYSDSKSDLPLAQISTNAYLIKKSSVTNWK